MFGAKLSWCQIVRFQIVLVPNCLGAKLSVFIILVPNCPLYYLGAKLSGAKLSGAKLSGAKLSGAKLSCNQQSLVAMSPVRDDKKTNNKRKDRATQWKVEG